MNARTTLCDVNWRNIHTITLAVINHFSQTVVQYESAQEVHVMRRNVLFQERDSTINVKQYESLLRI